MHRSRVAQTLNVPLQGKRAVLTVRGCAGGNVTPQPFTRYGLAGRRF
jgi:hypothetical protein